MQGGKQTSHRFSMVCSVPGRLCSSVFTHFFSLSVKQMLELSGASCAISDLGMGEEEQGNGDHGVQKRCAVKGYGWPQ